MAFDKDENALRVLGDEARTDLGRGRSGGGGHRGGGHRGGGRRFGGRGGGWGGPWGYGYNDYFDPYYSPVFIERPQIDMFDEPEEEPQANPKAKQLATLRTQYLAAKKKGDKKMTQIIARRIIALTTS